MAETDQDIYSALFNSATEGLVVAGNDGIISLINPRAEEMFGYGPGELDGKPIEVLLPEEYRKKHINHRENYSQKPVARRMGIGLDLYAQKKDGTRFPVEISLNHIKTPASLLIMALITDITERKKKDRQLTLAKSELEALNNELEKRVNKRTEELLESQKLYSLIARNFPGGTINVLDLNFNYVFAEGMELFKMGVTSESLKNTNYLERLPEEIRGHAEQQLINVKNGEPRSFEIRYSNNYYVLNAVPLFSPSREVREILLVETNVTKQKNAEENIKRSLEREIELNELKSRFVSMASHEFRTPLSAILSSASLIGKYAEKSEKIEKHVSRIKSSVTNLTGILNDFLSIDKLEEGMVQTNLQFFNVQEFANEVIEEVQSTAKSGQEIVFESDIQYADIIADAHILKNIIINLLSNAIKYSPENSRIILKAKTSKYELVFKIKDSGIGIPQEDQKHLFERFFRAKNVLNIQGTGLGLNIVKKYLDLLNGNISFTSTEGKGTEFIVTVPIKI